MNESNIKATTKAITLDLTSDDGRNLIAYINQPTKEEMVDVARIIGYIYSLAAKQDLDMLVLVRDWDILIEDFLAGLPNNAELRARLNGFFDRKIIASNVWDVETGEPVNVDDDTLNVIKGMLLFFTALLRYAPGAIKRKGLGAYLTSLTASEYQQYLKKQQEEAKRNAKLARQPSK